MTTSDSTSVTNKIALITGANRGIGLEAARQLAQQGYIVWIGARDAAKGQSAAESLRGEGLQAQSVQLDISDSQSIARAAQTLAAEAGHLDALINNAGIFLDWGIPASQTPMDLLRQTFAVNFFGVWETTQAFLPLLQKSAAGRIINVSSTAASHAVVSNPDSPYDWNRVPAYQASKAALNAITNQFARELRESKIKVNSVCPGYVNSGAPGTEHAPKSVQAGARILVKMATLPADGPTGGWFDDEGPIAW